MRGTLCMGDDIALNGTDTLLRYASPTRCPDGKALPTAFDLRPDENGLSANSIELCNESSDEDAIQQIVATAGEKRKLSKNGLFFHLPVELIEKTLSSCATISGVRIVADPIKYMCRNTDVEKNDDSHALVKWLEGNELIARELLVDCVSGTTGCD